MENLEDNWMSIRRRRAARAETTEPADMLEDWRALQGLQEFAYYVHGQWGGLALWKVRLLRLASARRGTPPRKAYIIEKVELLWHQPGAVTEKVRTMAHATIKTFRAAEASLDMTLMAASCRMSSIRDKARIETLDWRIELHKLVAHYQAGLEEATARLNALDNFRADAVVPADLLEAEEIEMEQAMEG